MARANFEQADQEFSNVSSFFKEELAKLRSGRANPELVSGVLVQAYEQKMPLEQLANINVADPTLLVVQPWDKSLTDDIYKALKAAELGIEPAVDGEIIRLPLPPLTQERREEYVKILKTKTEEARVSIRQVRKDILISLEQDQEAGNITEDDMKRKEKELQGKVEKYNEEIEEIGNIKQEELMQV